MSLAVVKPRARVKRDYYSVRHGRRPARGGFGLAELKSFFGACFDKLEGDGLFQEWFGYCCIDAGFVPGRAGQDLDLFVFRKIRKMGLWPIRANLDNYSQDDLFDVVEMLFDHASKGVDGHYHSYSQCGWHFEKFEKAAGQEAFGNAVNEILADFGDGYELSSEGEIMTLGDRGLDALLSAPLPPLDPKNVESRVAQAALKFRRRGSSGPDRRDAVRDLADVLEFLRADAKSVLDADDERDLFNLANNFGIRHHKRGQKTNYDEGIWLSWMFYYYLATIHVCVRLIEKSKAAGSKKAPSRAP